MMVGISMISKLKPFFINCILLFSVSGFALNQTIKIPIIAKPIAHKPIPSYSQTINKPVPNINPHFILNLYQIMKDTHEILTKNNIEYWAVAGTLLGTMRHKGQIPWDDDLDISIDVTQEKNFLALTPLFESLNYQIFPIYFGYKIFPKNGKPVPKTKFKMPFLDVFITFRQNNKIYYKQSGWGQRDGEPLYLTMQELYPITQYPFGAITINAPADPIPHLDAKYGKNWPTTAHKFNHLTNNKETITLTDTDKYPAQPLGPLKDRVK
jgi:lipopolysaccharide cholinephosphotransferase